jgi:UDP-GlcNAc3NAcA epimerase
MKILTVVGARPQFIKSAPVSRAIRKAGHTEYLVHTGQHYDYGMSQVFFDELLIPQPDLNLGVGSGLHGQQTGEMLIHLEAVIWEQKPDWVLVYGDTNSTLAGALAAVKLHVPLAHVEAGLRSFNRQMPEEINRILTDHVSDLLLCPSQSAVDNLENEGITSGVHLVGDVMSDALNYAAKYASQQSMILRDLKLEEKGFLVATVHRAENTDAPERLRAILDAFNALDEPVLFPVHPRTRNALQQVKYTLAPHVQLIEPLGYLDMVRLMQAARMILTDSGGMQKEAYWLGVPCVTLRDETEWLETVQAGWNILVGSDTAQIVAAIREWRASQEHPQLYGDGQVAMRVVRALI